MYPASHPKAAGIGSSAPPPLSTLLRDKVLDGWTLICSHCDQLKNLLNDRTWVPAFVAWCTVHCKSRDSSGKFIVRTESECMFDPFGSIAITLMETEIECCEAYRVNILTSGACFSMFFSWIIYSWGLRGDAFRISWLFYFTASVRWERWTHLQNWAVANPQLVSIRVKQHTRFDAYLGVFLSKKFVKISIHHGDQRGM